jgi:putative methionine-R-sulfoxide reductase with GAF domain
VNTQGAKYVIVFVIIAVMVAFQLISSFGLFPYLVTGQDMTFTLILLVSLLLVFTGRDLTVMQRRKKSVGEEISIGGYAETAPPPELELPKKFDEKDYYRYFTAMQSYLGAFSGMRELMDKLLVAAARVTHSQRASILLYNRKKDELFITRTLGWNESEIRLIKNTRIRPGEGIAGRVYLDGKPVVMNENEVKAEFEMKEKYRSNSFVSFPLFSGGTAIGVLNLTEKDKGAYSQREIEMVRFILNETSLHFSYLMQIGKEKLY